MTRKKLSILGTAPSFIRAPYRDNEYEIWGIGCGADRFERVDALFEFHRRNEYLTFLDRLNKPEVPVYMAFPHKEVKKSLAFPIDKLIEKYKDDFTDKPCLTSSITLMFVYALYLGYQYIELWGVHMSHSEEYGHQLPSIEYWIGYARGQRLTVKIAPESDILKSTYIYGFEEKDAKFYRLTERRAIIEKDRKEIEEKLYRHYGNKDIIAYLAKKGILKEDDKAVVEQMAKIQNNIEILEGLFHNRDGQLESINYQIQMMEQ